MRDPHAHPWILGVLRIRREVLARVDEEARESFLRGEESCGLLAGPAADPRLIDRILPMKNRANALHALDPETYPRTGHSYFDVDPLKVERAMQEGEKSGSPIKVLYHSHLDVDAYFSETDAAAATMSGDSPTHDFAYLVTSVRAGVIDGRKLFVWSPDTRAFVETPFEEVP